MTWAERHPAVVLMGVIALCGATIGGIVGGLDGAKSGALTALALAIACALLEPRSPAELPQH